MCLLCSDKIPPPRKNTPDSIGYLPSEFIPKQIFANLPDFWLRAPESNFSIVIKTLYYSHSSFDLHASENSLSNHRYKVYQDEYIVYTANEYTLHINIFLYRLFLSLQPFRRLKKHKSRNLFWYNRKRLTFQQQNGVVLEPLSPGRFMTIASLWSGLRYPYIHLYAHNRHLIQCVGCRNQQMCAAAIDTLGYADVSVVYLQRSTLQ